MTFTEVVEGGGTVVEGAGVAVIVVGALGPPEPAFYIDQLLADVNRVLAASRWASSATR